MQRPRVWAVVVRRFEASPSYPRAIALAFAIVLHLAMLPALVAIGSIRTRPLSNPPLLVVTLFNPLAVTNEDTSTASKRLVESSEKSAPPAPVLSPALPITTTPLPTSEPMDLAALAPQFDSEPDPALTGDVVTTWSLAPNAGAPGTNCPLVSSFRDALQLDLKTQAALAQIPRASRSVANAVMLWDGGWIVPEGSDPVRMTSVRLAIAEIISGFSEACRSQTNFGPLFVPVDGKTGTIVLALGSGAWRWADLVHGSLTEPIAPK